MATNKQQDKGPTLHHKQHPAPAIQYSMPKYRSHAELYDNN
jgi:hypothetical protein